MTLWTVSYTHLDVYKRQVGMTELQVNCNSFIDNILNLSRGIAYLVI